MSSSQSAAHFLGVAKQTAALRTVATGSGNETYRYLPMKAGGLQLERPPKASDELYGYEPRWLRAQNSSFSGSIPLLLYYSQIGIFLDNALHRTTTEVSSYVINGSNNTIYFDRSGAKTGTIASASYTASTLATAIAAAMNAEDSGQNPDYTCTYSTSTKKFTIAAAGGANFTLTNATTTNAVWSTIGFSTGDYSTPATTFTGAAQAPAVYDHLWTPQLTAQFEATPWLYSQYGLSLLDHRDWFTYQGIGALVNAITIGYAENDPHAPAITFGVKGCVLTRISAVTPTFSTDVPATPDGKFIFTAVTNGVTHTGYPVKNFNLQITPAVDLRWKIGDMYPVRAIHTGKIAYNATWGWDLEDVDSADGGGTTNLNQDFETSWLDADATCAITVTQTGETIRGAIAEGLTVSMPAMRPSGGTPQAQAGTLEFPFQAQGQYDTTNGAKGLQITLRSTEVFP